MEGRDRGLWFVVREMKEGGGRESTEALSYFFLYLSQREKETTRDRGKQEGERAQREGVCVWFCVFFLLVFWVFFFCTSVTQRDRETAIIIF